VSLDMQKSTGLVMAAAAAALFSAGTVAVVAPAKAAVKCMGANACKGMSACMTASTACKGMNACKGQGWIEAKDAAECVSKGGKAG